MPFCTSCGTEVDPRASFCRNCGAPQQRTAGATAPPPPPPFVHPDVLGHISDRTACLLCYIPVCGIIPAIICLAAHKYRTNYRVRFHAFQALYIFVAWLIASSIAPGGPGNWPGGPAIALAHLSGLAQLLVFVCWIFMLVKISQGQDTHLPVFGDLAARSTHEQL